MGSQPSRTSFLLLLHKMMMMMMMKHLLKSSMPNFFERRKRKKSVRVAVPNWLALSHSSSCCWRSQHCWAAAIHQLPARIESSRWAMRKSQTRFLGNGRQTRTMLVAVALTSRVYGTRNERTSARARKRKKKSRNEP